MKFGELGRLSQFIHLPELLHIQKVTSRTRLHPMGCPQKPKTGVIAVVSEKLKVINYFIFQIPRLRFAALACLRPPSGQAGNEFHPLFGKRRFVLLLM
jgi:hypothetical protein